MMEGRQDRDFEWSALLSFAGSASPRVRLGIVSGRRRQGKTFLLRALAEATGAFYYAAAEATTADSLRDLGAALAAHTGAALPYAIRDWNEAIVRFGHGGHGRLACRERAAARAERP
jgi:hypothetical protein